MYPPGHVGIALALYAPVGLLLLLRGRARLAVVGTIAVTCLTLLPDVDTWLPWFVHRGRTHTVFFALVTGATLGSVAAAVGSHRDLDRDQVAGLGIFGLFVGTLAVLAHLLGDVITPMGVRPFYPLSDASYTFALVFASDTAANARLFAVGCIATVAQFVLGVGFAPEAPGRATLHGALAHRSSALEGGSGRAGDALRDSGDVTVSGAGQSRQTPESDD